MQASLSMLENLSEPFASRAVFQTHILSTFQHLEVKKRVLNKPSSVVRPLRLSCTWWPEFCRGKTWDMALKWPQNRVLTGPSWQWSPTKTICLAPILSSRKVAVYPYHRLALLTLKILKISKKRDWLCRMKGWLQCLHLWRKASFHQTNSAGINMAYTGYFWASPHNWDKALRLSSLKKPAPAVKNRRREAKRNGGCKKSDTRLSRFIHQNLLEAEILQTWITSSHLDTHFEGLPPSQVHKNGVRNVMEMSWSFVKIQTQVVQITSAACQIFILKTSITWLAFAKGKNQSHPCCKSYKIHF